MKSSILDLPLGEWPTLVAEAGSEPFRAGQIAEWIFKKRANDFDRMTSLPLALRTYLKARYTVRALELDRAVTSREDGTTRYFFKAIDGETVSCVYLPYEGRRSLCLSTQVGCAWGCVFCASGLVQLKRNLSTAEIIDQIFIVEEATSKSLTSLLFMGMGEPLANYQNLIRSLQLIRSNAAIGMGSRHVTVSTCGLVPQIISLAEDAPKVNLAVSLHAVTDEIRKTLMPKASSWTVKEVIRSAKAYSIKTGASVTFEYIVIHGVNDSVRDAQRLANLIRDLAQVGDYWVNLIRYNPVPGLPYKTPTEETIEMFKRILDERRVPVRLRKSQGVDIGAGCGQLGEALNF